jgi:hypothetical protein
LAYFVAAIADAEGAGVTKPSLNMLPIYFEPNVGQAAAPVDFVARAGGYALFLTADAATFRVPNSIDGESTPSEVQMQIIGSNPAASVRREQAEGRVNYFMGDNPARWRTNVPTYRQVTYGDVYPGIDLVYYSSQHSVASSQHENPNRPFSPPGREDRVEGTTTHDSPLTTHPLEYDFIVAPGADPRQIRLYFAGADSVAIEADGDLVIRAGETELRQQKPYLYQEVNGARQQVAGEFRIEENSETRIRNSESCDMPEARASSICNELRATPLPPRFEFLTAEYAELNGERTKEMINDVCPSQSAGGTHALRGYDMTAKTRASCPLETTGETPALRRHDTTSTDYCLLTTDYSSTDYSPTVSFQIGHYDTTRPLVIDPILTYSSFLGGSGDESGRDIVTDATGHIYVNGHTSSVDFPVGPGFQPLHGGGFDSFVTKLTPDGKSLVYSTYLGGGGDDLAGRLALDRDGNIYLTGDTTSTDFPTANALQASSAGGTDAFVTKLSADGSSLMYSTYLGGSGDDDGRGIAVDRTGHAYVTGRTGSIDFPTHNAVQDSLRGGKDAFAAKVSPDGTAFIFSTYLGGAGSVETGYDVAVDAGANAYFIGRTDSSDFPTVNALQGNKGGGTDVFVVKLSGNGSTIAYSTYLGGTLDDHGRRIETDASGNAYITGATFSSDFPINNPVQPLNGGGDDAFVAKLNTDGSALVFSTFLGGGQNDQGFGITVNPRGTVFLTGSTASLDFPLVNALQTARRGSIDVFVARLNAMGSQLLYSTYLGGTGNDFGIAISADAFGNAYVTGATFSGDFPIVRAFQPLLKGPSDAFVVKINPLSRWPLT